MVQQKPINESFDSSNLLFFLYKWRKPLLWVIAVAIVGSTIVSLLLTNKYRSTVIMYPAATNAISQALLTQNRSSMQKGILDFGVDEETEQILQILHSNRIRDRIIEEFGLEQHYGINPESKYRLSKLHRQYENNISFRRTEFMAIRISVLDTDPNYAADIANRISDLLDSTKSQIQHERAKKAFEIVKSQYFKLADEMQQMEDSLTELRKHGVQDYESQAEMLNMQLAKEMAANNTVGVQRLQEKLDILAQYGGAYVNIRDRLEYEREKLSLLKAKYEEAKTDAEEVLPTKFVVNSAFPAERKSYPIRWLIISVTTISAFFFALIIILILENVKQNFPFIASKAKTKRQQGLNTKDENREINDQFDKQGKPLAFTSKNGTEVKNANKISEEDLSVISGSIIEQIKKSVLQELSQQNSQNDSTSNFQIQTEKNDNQMDKLFTNTNLLKMLFKWKTHLAVILLISILVAVVLSSPIVITPKFKSYAVIYPANILSYSEESETEQMLQFLQSRDIRDHLIAKYDLAQRYKIDSSYKYFQSTIIYEYSKNVKISKTPYESVLIEVFDSDPQVACDMVNDIIYFFNEKMLQTHREKFGEVVDFLQQRLDSKRAEIDSILIVHDDLRINCGIIDFPNQSREVVRGFLRTVDGNNAAANINTKEVLELKKNLELYGGEWIFYNDRLYNLVDEYSKIKIDLDEANMDFNKEITYANIVSAPFPADKKAYPVRWIIVTISAIGALLLFVVIVMVLENYESLKKKF
ncbi:MAG: hypothetical protein WBH71_03680 [Bacteroidales bacterium]|jgi:uncharacterized protein involved in exopolysaccharide biosynthesis|nr:hypothetical protein [Bacteroidales bacterium]MDI9591978.1 hypothetical protein [Bacteroidota bacterium]HOR76216.1 hypothetical protein [Bacteroidales bacterium]HPL11623.1 hypothetical protein [Bacteroidales bacterium]